MSSINSHADLMLDWEGLLAACKDHAGSLANAEPQRLALEEVLLRGKVLKERQESLVAQKQRATQELKALKAFGKESARRLRGAVKSVIGTDNELLVQFGMAPTRKRGPRKAKPPEVKTPEVKPPAGPSPA